MTGLGPAFQPQRAAPVPAAASTDRPANALPGLRVVVISASRSVASIDGQVVHKGDVVNGMKVTRIDQQGVELSGEDGTKEKLTISPAVVKRKTAAAAALGQSGGPRP
jgi:hypothetical protein